MSTTKRLAFLLIGLLILAGAATALTTGDASDDGGSTITTPLTVTATTPSATTSAGPKPPLLKAGSERTLTVEKGDVVRFRVVHPTAEEVHVHGYDFTFDLTPGVTKTISFPARIEGQFEIELEQSATPLAKLVVNPR